MIKSRSTIDNRLDGKIVTGCEKQYCCILTHLEEESVVRFVKNKNRCLQGINKKQLTNLILDILKIRDYANKKLKGGRRYTNLSVNAKRALQNKKLSRSFWKRWDAKHDDLRMKRQGTVTMNRAMNCTRDMASSHLDALAKELIDAGIFTNTKQVAPGVWTGQINTSRVFNHDETPQFINYGVDGTPNAGRGESCKRMINENRECVTINPVVSVSGFVCVCQVIFGTTGITDHMAPKTVVEKIDNLLISTTDNGCQDHTSLLACYKLFDKYLDKENIERPVVLTSDGHSSRFDYEVLKLCLEKKIRLFISPPDTTGVTQLLDQCNRNIHLEYKVAKACLFKPTMKVNREGFMLSLANMWDKWATPTLIRKAAKRVGSSCNRINLFKLQTLWSVKGQKTHLHPRLQTTHLLPPPHLHHQTIFEKGLPHTGRQSLRWLSKPFVIATRKAYGWRIFLVS